MEIHTISFFPPYLVRFEDGEELNLEELTPASEAFKSLSCDDQKVVRRLRDLYVEEKAHP
ncbi:hypothetical protein [uncultured Pseudoteredinibacter sp.]|uniref:hypothetical protein n=1 Tax=uncultured Pseudoteredinibacter sp. TaxID=1641701 RepID=UPI00262916D2|nr:hypothetical protein [uncultured Pseudoteredinibacter sp.]